MKLQVQNLKHMNRGNKTAIQCLGCCPPWMPPSRTEWWDALMLMKFGIALQFTLPLKREPKSNNSKPNSNLSRSKVPLHQSIGCKSRRFHYISCCHGRKFSSSKLLLMGLEKTLGVKVNVSAEEAEGSMIAILDRLEL